MIPPEDPHSKPEPSELLKSRARVVIFHGEHDNVKHMSRRLFGRELELSEYAGLAGAPDSADVSVGTINQNQGLYLEVRGSAVQGYTSVQNIYLKEGRRVLVNENFQVSRISARGHGIGLSVIRRQLYCASLLGIYQIEVTAGRSDKENGYYTWPRFGFDGPLSTSVRNVLPPELEQAQTVLDLMESDTGRLWWKDHGQTMDVVFHMSESSRSWKVFDQYVRERSPQVEGEVDPNWSRWNTPVNPSDDLPPKL